MNPHSDRCLFFSRMGACRHGDNCVKLHLRPTTSPTVLCPMLYPNPLAIEYVKDANLDVTFDKKYLKRHFERFYKQVWRTFMEFGRIAELRVVSNLGEHLLGNVYIRFEDPAGPEVAARIVSELYKKKLRDVIVLPELSPVTNFADACCKEDLEGACNRGSQCNYLHIMKVSRKLLEKLTKEQDKYWKDKEKKTRKRERSTSRTHSTETCHICGKPGHISRECPLK
ncbi:splicing factor U2AF 35 kDa subunit [Angomonas deanei]|uniref:Zinc finger C-x8-C-x5-C-x3-H type (And similar)/Zinc knuckle, putative n=1 Tax=Angomonas deanei TaxID=59799 RepID=A0A7G2CTB1_9TRYP|nr:splicing factor U2AF 35 kDa subunit [Angomonas deanei]CAD2222978.1 Zinc finger C-x8-C-x5-C-x3-H type (and similar)/Zinc knuckle, putative [Angomonas deanei]|eukprot:EPY35424.1 splicing factor U2AF 35 kDa subunit [Angomonas deanei]